VAIPATLDGPGGSPGDDAPQPQGTIAAPSKNVGNNLNQVLITKSKNKWY
jgi:hypothetical protein